MSVPCALTLQSIAAAICLLNFFSQAVAKHLNDDTWETWTRIKIDVELMDEEWSDE